MRKTKIVCTLGPAVDSVEAISGLLEKGMNGARFNMSHGNHESHLATLRRLEEAMEKTGLKAAKIMDTKGPEIRIRTFAESPVQLEEGDRFTLYAKEIQGTKEGVSVSYPDLAKELSAGNTILIDDGLIELKVEAFDKENVVCTVVNGGPLSNNKSINIPGSKIALPALTKKDREDLAFAVEHDYDFIAASFVRSVEDVKEIRKTLDELGGKDIRIISKIENQQGTDNMDEIIEASDGIMVARGDLGVEIPAAKVPKVQKEMILASRKAGKIVIVATQMLDSMIHNPRPTRAEVSDVANAVYEMASCVMLSGETANGEHPMESVDTMRMIVEETERTIDYWEALPDGTVLMGKHRISNVVTYTACVTALELKARAIVAPTQTGYTAGMVGRFRPACPIIALTPSEKVARQLSLAWGIHPQVCTSADSTDALFEMCEKEAAELEGAKQGDMIVVVAGVPVGKAGNTNLVKAHKIR